MELCRTTPQAVSRYLGQNGYAAAIRNKSVSCHAGTNGCVTVHVYPGDPRRMVDILNSSGYEAKEEHRAVVITGRYR
jgi:hypothetical protein